MGTKSEIIKGILLFNATSVFGPLIVLGGLGILLDSLFHTGRIFLFISIALAFVMTQVMTMRKLKSYSKIMKDTEGSKDAK